MTGRLKGVLFDLDDTLIDWSGVEVGWRELEARHLAQVLAFLNHKPLNSQVNLGRLVDLYSQRTREAWAQARKDLYAPNMPEILLTTLAEIGVAGADLYRREILDAYDWNVVPGTVVFSDVLPMLKTLRDSGVKLGIVTNASQPMSLRDAELAAHGLIEFFPDCRLAAADAGFLKPHPRIFAEALSRMGTAPTETIFVGDNPVADIKGALDAGMRAVLRLTGRADFDAAAGRTARERASAAAYKRDRLDTQRSLSSLDELPAILDAWYPGWQNSGA